MRIGGNNGLRAIRDLRKADADLCHRLDHVEQMQSGAWGAEGFTPAPDVQGPVFARIIGKSVQTAASAPSLTLYLYVIVEAAPAQILPSGDSQLPTVWTDRWESGTGFAWTMPAIEYGDRVDVPIDGSAIVELRQVDFADALGFMWGGENIWAKILTETAPGVFSFEQVDPQTNVTLYRGYVGDGTLNPLREKDGRSFDTNSYVQIRRGACSGYPAIRTKVTQSGDDVSVPTQQQVVVTGAPVSGTWRMTLTDPVTGNTYNTSSMAYNVSTAAFEAALEAIGGPFTAFTVTGLGTLASPWIVQFDDSFANYPVMKAYYPTFRSDQEWWFERPNGIKVEAVGGYSTHNYIQQLDVLSDNGAIVSVNGSGHAQIDFDYFKTNTTARGAYSEILPQTGSVQIAADFKIDANFAGHGVSAEDHLLFLPYSTANAATDPYPPSLGQPAGLLLGAQDNAGLWLYTSYAVMEVTGGGSSYTQRTGAWGFLLDGSRVCGGLIASIGSSGAAIAIGSTVTGGTTGSILFVGSGGLAQDNSSFFFDQTNKQLGIGTASPGAKIQASAGSAAEIGMIVKGFASQTANLQEWQDSAGTVSAAVSKGGYIISKKTSAIANGDVASGDTAGPYQA